MTNVPKPASDDFRFSNLITRRQTVLAAAWATLLPRHSWAASKTAGIDDVLRAGVADRSIPGVVAVAADRNGVFYSGAFGLADMANARAMREDHLFRIASMTKAVTSVAALQLIEQGKFALEDPVRNYLPEFAKLQKFQTFDPTTGAYTLAPVTRPVTVRHLFTHTSGIGYPFVSSILRDFKPRAGDSYPVGPLLFEPGERWQYGPSTAHLGHLVEKISGQNLEEYFRAHIFAPLGMHDTFYNVPKEKEQRLIPVHRRELGGVIAAATLPPNPQVQPRGDGGLASTAADYIRFTRMILNNGELDGAHILKPDSVAAMRRNQIGNIGVSALKTAIPETSADFSFIADGRDKWSLGFLITVDAAPSRRSSGSLSWGGINNTYYWIDPSRGISGVICMQFLQFADPKALTLYDAFEHGIYALKA